MGALVEILEVRLDDSAVEELRGRFIDQPRKGMTCEGHALHLMGWVLERGAPAIALDVVQDEETVYRVPIEVLRPDLAAAFPDIPQSGRAGFNASLNVLGRKPEVLLELLALLRDGRHVPIATIVGRRCWRQSSAAAGMELVSVVVIAGAPATDVERSVASALMQTHPHVEVVVVGSPGCFDSNDEAWRGRGVRFVPEAEPSTAVRRNTGLRSTIGDLLVFLNAGERLLPGALQEGLKGLRAHPHAAAAWGRHRYVGDRPASLRLPAQAQPEPALRPLAAGSVTAPPNPDDAAGTAMFRRAAFELFGPFDTASPGDAQVAMRSRIEQSVAVHVHDVVIAEVPFRGADPGGTDVQPYGDALERTATVG
jgi:hypothetical protein